MAYPSSKHLICKFLRINTFKNPYCIRFSETVNAHFCKHYSSAAQTAQVGDYKPKSAKIDRAMQEYLKRAKEYNDFMKEELKEFELGKKHLANMMGANPDNFSQEDIDKAIEYLFPSALFDPHARPLMKHPEIVFPKRKEAEFDETGRPYHHLFYTSKPNFSQLLHDAATHIQELDKHYYRMLKEGKTPEEDKKLIAAAFTWFTKENLESHIIESILDADYKAFVDVMDRLINHPYSYLAEDFIRTYQKKIAVATTKQEIPVPEKGPDGRFFITAPLNQRKTSVASVTIRSPGTGKIAINDSDINYFKRWTQSKEQVWS